MGGSVISTSPQSPRRWLNCDLALLKLSQLQPEFALAAFRHLSSKRRVPLASGVAVGAGHKKRKSTQPHSEQQNQDPFLSPRGQEFTSKLHNIARSPSLPRVRLIACTISSSPDAGELAGRALNGHR